MNKTPDEIKKALECCFYDSAQCRDCPYYPTSCDRELVRDAREYIRQLEAERDALLVCVKGQCWACKFSDCSFAEEPCVSCFADRRLKWEWRGLQKEC